MIVKEYTCVKVSVDCKERTKSVLWIEKNLGGNSKPYSYTDHYSKQELEELLFKNITRDKRRNMKEKSIEEDILEIENVFVANLQFKFLFMYRAEVKVDFYAEKIPLRPVKVWATPTEKTGRIWRWWIRK